MRIGDNGNRCGPARFVYFCLFSYVNCRIYIARRRRCFFNLGYQIYFERLGDGILEISYVPFCRCGLPF